MPALNSKTILPESDDSCLPKPSVVEEMLQELIKNGDNPTYITGEISFDDGCQLRNFIVKGGEGQFWCVGLDAFHKNNVRIEWMSQTFLEFVSYSTLIDFLNNVISAELLSEFDNYVREDIAGEIIDNLRSVGYNFNVGDIRRALVLFNW